MTKKFLKTLEAEIEKYKQELLKLEPKIYENSEIAEIYNKTLIKKAILVDRYKKVLNRKSFFTKAVSLMKFKKEPKLICDFFPNI